MKNDRHKNIHGGQEEISLGGWGWGGEEEKTEELYKRERDEERMKDKTCRKET